MSGAEQNEVVNSGDQKVEAEQQVVVQQKLQDSTKQEAKKKRELQITFMTTVEEMKRLNIDFPDEFAPCFSIRDDSNRRGHELTIRPHINVEFAEEACGEPEDHSPGKWWRCVRFEVVQPGETYHHDL